MADARLGLRGLTEPVVELGDRVVGIEMGAA